MQLQKLNIYALVSVNKLGLSVPFKYSGCESGPSLQSFSA